MHSAFSMNQKDNPYELIHVICYPDAPCYANGGLNELQELINAGYDLNLPYENKPPLDWAHHISIIKILIANNAKVTIASLTLWLDPWKSVNSFLIPIWGSDSCRLNILNTLLLNVDHSTLETFISRCKLSAFAAFVGEKEFNLGDEWKPNMLSYLRMFLYYDPNIQGIDLTEISLEWTDINILHKLAQNNEVEVVKTLLWYGADVAVCDKDGKTAFDKTTDPTLKKLLAIEPRDPEEYNRNPKQYRDMYPQEFNPVSKYPHEFNIEQDCYTILEVKLKKHRIKKKHGSIFNYLKLREIGETK